VSVEVAILYSQSKVGGTFFSLAAVACTPRTLILAVLV
jgi:hypothetical protein